MKMSEKPSVKQDLICICKQKTYSPVSSINSSQSDKDLPVKTSKPNFVTLFVYFGNSLFDYLKNIYCLLRQESAYASSVELEVHQ